MGHYILLLPSVCSELYRSHSKPLQSKAMPVFTMRDRNKCRPYFLIMLQKVNYLKIINSNCLSWIWWKLFSKTLSFFWMYALTSAIMSEEVLQCRNKVIDGKGGNILQNHSQTNQRSSKEQWHLVHLFFSMSDCWGHYYSAKISSTAQTTMDVRRKETSWFDQCVWVYIYTCMCGQVCVWGRVYK